MLSLNENQDQHQLLECANQGHLGKCHVKKDFNLELAFRNQRNSLQTKVLQILWYGKPIITRYSEQCKVELLKGLISLSLTNHYNGCKYTSAAC